MDGELTTLAIMYTVTVSATGQIFAESNESAISTICLRNNWNWPFETVNCNIIVQLDEVIVVQLTPLQNDFTQQRVRMNLMTLFSPQFDMNPSNRNFFTSHRNQQLKAVPIGM